MYRLFRGPVLALFRAPTGEPTPPGGAHAKVEIFRASPRFLTYRLLGLGIGVLGVLAIGGVFTVGGLASGEPEVALAAIAVSALCLFICTIGYLSIHLDYDLRYYVFTERSLRVREGAWIVKEKTITYANVQNLHVRQGPLQRLFGIKDLRIDTAGGGGAAPGSGKSGGHAHSITVAGVENAAELRDRILDHIKRLGAGSGLGDPDDEERPARGTGTDPLHEALEGVADAARRLHLASKAASR